MRAFFFGGMNARKRNDPVKLVEKHPHHDMGDDVHTGNAMLDGFSLLSKADPDRQGSPPPVEGQDGPCYQGPDQSFEQ